MTKPAWLFESDIFGEGTQLREEIVKQGMTVTTADSVPGRTVDSYIDLFPEYSCVILHGTLGFAAQIRRETTWVPGAFADQSRLTCTSYYPHLGQYLLAQDYIMLPYGDLLRQKEFLYETLGEDETIFIRPNSGNKIFTGQVVYYTDFDEEIPDLGYGAIDHFELVVVSPPRNITHEWRFVVADGEVITGSTYIIGDKHSRLRLNIANKKSKDYAAYNFSQDVANVGYHSERAYTLDVCETAMEGLFLLELNSFSCSGLYACDPRPIVREVSRIAIEEWENTR